MEELGEIEDFWFFRNSVFNVRLFSVQIFVEKVKIFYLQHLKTFGV
jgi:hypothetical protein